MCNYSVLDVRRAAHGAKVLALGDLQGAPVDAEDLGVRGRHVLVGHLAGLNHHDGGAGVGALPLVVDEDLARLHGLAVQAVEVLLRVDNVLDVGGGVAGGGADPDGVVAGHLLRVGEGLDRLGEGDAVELVLGGLEVELHVQLVRGGADLDAGNKERHGKLDDEKVAKRLEEGLDVHVNEGGAERGRNVRVQRPVAVEEGAAEASDAGRSGKDFQRPRGGVNLGHGHGDGVDPARQHVGVLAELVGGEGRVVRGGGGHGSSVTCTGSLLGPGPSR